MSDVMPNGVSPGDIHVWLAYVKSENVKRGVNLRFEWAPVKTRGGFSVEGMVETIISLNGMYLLLGKAKLKNRIWFTLMVQMELMSKKKNTKEKTMKKGKAKEREKAKRKEKAQAKKAVAKLTEKERYATYAKKASEISRDKCDHAMGLKVFNYGGTCYNNGYGVLNNFSSTFSSENLAKQMIGLSVCYSINLFEVKNNF